MRSPILVSAFMECQFLTKLVRFINKSQFCLDEDETRIFRHSSKIHNTIMADMAFKLELYVIVFLIITGVLS